MFKYILVCLMCVCVLGCSSDEEPSVLKDMTESPAEIQKAIYWTEGTTIKRANVDGSNVEVLATGLDDSTDIALDIAGGKMYWADSWAAKIQRANLDGTNMEVLITFEVAVLGISILPADIAIDVSEGKMYWTDGWATKIQRANLDGTNIEVLITFEDAFEWADEAPDVFYSKDIALDTSGGKMYLLVYLEWGRGSGTDSIIRANLDGSNAYFLPSAKPLERMSCIALDTSGGEMYLGTYDWHPTRDKIVFRNLGVGAYQGVLVTVDDLLLGDMAFVSVKGIALDVPDDKMYWISSWSTNEIPMHAIQRANLDGTDIEVLITDVGFAQDIAIGVSSPTENAFCITEK